MPSGQIRLEIDAARTRFVVSQAGLEELLRTKVARDLARRAIRVETAAKQNASQPPRGGIPHAGSEPGHGPAVRTGRLRGSITWRLGADTRGPYADIGTAVLYGPYVEYGTTRMAARPFLRPALEAGRI